MSLTPGSRLGSYEVTALIGSGGMGSVYKAHDPKLQRTVAIKVLAKQDADASARLLQEARAASALNHPHICTIHEVGEHEGQAFIVMEYVEGKPLSQLIPSDGLPPESVIRYGAQIADALAHAHERGIVHRDLKSANVVITPEGRAKVLDFGLAARLPRADAEAVTKTQEALPHAQAGMLVGTLAYMAPEVLRGESATARSDIWALGVLLYEMASGRLPFDTRSVPDLTAAILKESPSALPARVMPGLRALAQRALAKENAHRYATSGEVRAALEALGSFGTADSTATANTPSTSISIAVLPFTNMSADPDQEYFCDGLTDEIITDLSQLRALRIISRSSSKQLKDSGKDLKTVASELDVRYVLEGSIRKAGNAVRVTVQLIDPAADEHLWAQKYSGKLEDIFEIQEQISRRIVDALQMRLSPEEDHKLAERAFDNVEAFECYHRARQEIYTFTEDGLDRALKRIKAALDLVGENELLYAAMGTAYWQYVNAAIKPDERYVDQAEAWARKVFALNPDSAAGHALLGGIRLTQGRVAEAMRSFKAALAIDPNSPDAVMELGRVYEQAGFDHQARSAFQRALSVDPLSPIVHGARLSNELMSGHTDVVQQDAPALLRSRPEFAYVRWVYAVSLIYSERLADALAVLEAAPDEESPTIAGRQCLFLKLALQGNRSQAAECVGKEFMAGAWKVEWWSGWMAECYAFADEPDLAIDWLENAFQRGFINYPYFSKHSKIFRTLDDNPRFQELLGKIRIAWEQFEP